MNTSGSDRTPVVVGVAQRTWHATTQSPAPEPAAMMAATVRAAAADAGTEKLLARATGLWTVDVASWRYACAPAVVAEMLGIAPAHLLSSTLGGEQPQVLFGSAAAAIAAGEHDVVVVAGAEAFRTRRLVRQTAQRLDWRTPDPGGATWAVERDPSHPLESAAGVRHPVDYYPLFETALRADAGRSLAEHRQMLGRLWAGFAAVAETNPHATLRSAPDAAQIATPTAKNRMIGFPYPKLMTANIFVDMAASVILCSAAVAAELGVSRDNWVFPLAAATGDDAWFVTDRARLDRSPAIRRNAEAALGAAGVGIDDVAHLDLYSCFPSAVQLAAQELGIPVAGADLPLTVTGGLTFAGGPGSNYSTHGLVALVETLRADPGSLGLLTANGMFSTKHALGLYGTRPPRDAFALIEHGTVEDGGRVTLEDHVGPATLETYVVKHDEAGEPEHACLVGLTGSGHRVWAGCTDPDVLHALEHEELLGSRIRVDRATAHLD